MKKTLLALLLMAFSFTSCLKDEPYGYASLSEISNTMAFTANDDVTVTATVTAIVPITSVVLKYQVAGGTEQSIPMTASGSTYTAVIPAQALDTEVTYYIEATTAEGVIASAPISYVVGAVPIDYSGLSLNELNGNDKFIELFNNGTTDIPISGVYIEKDGEKNWTAPNITLAAGEYLLLYSEDVVTEHPDHSADLIFSSGLSAKKAVRVQLFSPTGTSIDDFNLVNYSTPAPASYSRWPNGNGPWVYADATPGAMNAAGTEAVSGLEGAVVGNKKKVVLNELDSNNKFFELYNAGTEAIDLTGYYIEKDEERNWTAPSITLAAGDYLLLYSEDVAADHPSQPADLIFSSGFSGKKSVSIVLFDPAGTSVDSFIRGEKGTGWGNQSMPEDKSHSFSRVPNGSGEWAYADSTPDAENGAKTGDIVWN